MKCDRCGEEGSVQQIGCFRLCYRCYRAFIDFLKTPKEVQTIIRNSYFMERLNGKYENENEDDQDSE